MKLERNAPGMIDRSFGKMKMMRLRSKTMSRLSERERDKERLVRRYVVTTIKSGFQRSTFLNRGGESAEGKFSCATQWAEDSTEEFRKDIFHRELLIRSLYRTTITNMRNCWRRCRASSFFFFLSNLSSSFFLCFSTHMDSSTKFN